MLSQLLGNALRKYQMSVHKAVLNFQKNSLKMKSIGTISRKKIFVQLNIMTKTKTLCLLKI